jgi:hypothetical protein
MLVNISCISIGLYAAIRDFMAFCDDVYTTIAQLEYMGPSYPNELEYDPGIAGALDAIDFDAISSNPATEIWDPSAVALGYIDGTSGMNSLAPYKKNAVLVVRIDGYIENERVNSGIITEALYSYDDVEGKIVYVDTGTETLEPGRYYLMHGEFYFGRTSMKYFRPGPFINACAKQEGFDSTAEKMIADITAEGRRYSIPEDSCFRLIANTYKVINNSVTVHATNDAESLYPFHQQTLYLSEGRFFYQRGVCFRRQGMYHVPGTCKKAGCGDRRCGQAFPGSARRLRKERELSGGLRFRLFRKLYRRRADR